MSDKIGHIYTCLTPYQSKGKISMKQRPVLIIGQADGEDYTALPISKISVRKNINNNYDIPLNIAEYPILNLTCDSFVRTHKIFTATKITLYRDISNLKESYPDLYSIIITKFSEYTTHVSELESSNCVNT